MAGEFAPDLLLHLRSQESPIGADNFYRTRLLWQETAVLRNWERFGVSLLQTHGQVLSLHFHIKVEDTALAQHFCCRSSDHHPTDSRVALHRHRGYGESQCGHVSVYDADTTSSLISLHTVRYRLSYTCTSPGAQFTAEIVTQWLPFLFKI